MSEQHDTPQEVLDALKKRVGRDREGLASQRDRAFATYHQAIGAIAYIDAITGEEGISVDDLAQELRTAKPVSKPRKAAT